MAISEKFADESGEVTVLKPPLDMSREAVIEKLLAVEPVLRKRGVAALSLFGSVARDEATSDSDVDILFEADPDRRIGLLERIGIKLFLEDVFGYEVDAVRLGNIREESRDRVFSEAVRVF